MGTLMVMQQHVSNHNTCWTHSTAWWPTQVFVRSCNILEMESGPRKPDRGPLHLR